MTRILKPLLLAAAAALAACSANPESQSPPSAEAAPVPAGSTPSNSDSAVARADLARIVGSPDAKVWLIMSSDFQCPYCKEFHDQTWPQIEREYVKTGKVRFAFINHPMSFHQFAVPAAEAAMCAGVQDRFWPMHDALYNTQEIWTRRPYQPVFDSLATALKLDTAAWRSCMSTHLTRPRIEADFASSRQAGVSGTPSFVIGGRMAIEGAAPFADFRKTLDSALAAAGSGR